MKLWIVSRRAPLLRGHRTVTIEHWAVMAPTAEEAIEVEVSKVREPEMREFFLGTWTADLVEGAQSVSLRNTYETPTDAERADLAERVRRTTARMKKVKS